MKSVQSLNKSFSVKFITLSIFIMLSVSLTSVFLLYANMNDLLGVTYNEKLRALSLYKLKIGTESILVFVGLAVISLLGIVISGILYTHRVVGPLYRIRTAAREISGGKYETHIKFRQDDVIQPLADSLNEFARVYVKRRESIRENLEGMLIDARSLSEAIRNGDIDKGEEEVSKMATRTNEVGKILSGIKL